MMALVEKGYGNDWCRNAKGSDRQTSVLFLLPEKFYKRVFGKFPC
jgi:hypothetical protein